jgi:hypothetical protein
LGIREIVLTIAKKKLTHILATVAGLASQPIQRVCKVADVGCTRIEFTFPKGKLVLHFTKSEGLHAIIGAYVEIAVDGHINTYEAVRDSGDRLDVHPITLAELTKMSESFGSASARLLQLSVVADGTTNHANIIIGRLSSHYKTAATDA